MSVHRDDSGQWWAACAGRREGPFRTNHEAWRAVDRMEGQPVSRSEQVSQWVWDRTVDGQSKSD